MPVILGRNYQLAELEVMYAPLYEDRLDILGTSGIILPIGDRYHGQPDATTFTTFGDEQATFTWSEAPSAFDTGLDLTAAASYQGIIPIVSFNGTDEEADSPNAPFWTPGTALTFDLWLNPDTVAAAAEFLANFDTNQREWFVGMDGSGNPQMGVYDETNNAQIGRQDATPLVAGVWSHLVFTWDGGTTNADCAIYLNGVKVDDTNNGSGSGWTSVVNGTSLVDLMNRGAARFFDGKVAGACLGPGFADKAVNLDEVKRLYDLGRRALML